MASIRYGWALLLICSALSSAHAQQIVDSGGFESNQLGDLHDQDVTVNGGLGVWQETVPNLSSVQVVDTIASTGSQSVAYTNFPGSFDRVGVVVPALSTVPVSTIVEISFDLYIPTYVSVSPFGPVFGLEANDEVSLPGQPVELLGFVGVDAATREVLHQAPGTGVLTPTGPRVNYNEWNTFQLQLNYSLDTYSIFLNDSLVDTFEFVDGPALDGLTDVAIRSTPAAGETTSTTAYFDNVGVVAKSTRPPFRPPSRSPYRPSLRPGFN